MKIEELINKPLPEIPDKIRQGLKDCNITATAFEDKNHILTDDALTYESGYKKFEDGSYLVSMYCPMSDITPEMFQWWFWWHPQESIRYKVWFPGEHYAVGYSKGNEEYFNVPVMPKFSENIQYPTEKIAGIPLPLEIDFVTPEHFGFDPDIMRESNVPIIVCGHVGTLKGLIMHTEMSHIFKITDNGPVLISRFWLGKTLKNPLLRKLILNDSTALGMAEHCCIEYRNLTEILPGLYSEYALDHVHNLDTEK